MGLDLGFEQEGITSLLASEIDTACRKTIALNRPDMALIGDISSYSNEQIRNMAGLCPTDEIDVIIGGPPCQAFSTAGQRKGFTDTRGNLFLIFIDKIIGLRPKFAVIENVRGILSAPLKHTPHKQRDKSIPIQQDEQKGSALMLALDKLRNGGYTISFNLYNAALFGAPQARERVIILCSRDGKKAPYLTPTHSEYGHSKLLPLKTLRDVLQGQPDTPEDYVEFPEKRLKYYRLLKSGENWKSLPIELQKEALGKSFYAGGGKTGFLRRLSWDKPSPTLVTHPAMPATDLAHPEKDRPLSVQEYKRIQEFPDTWQLGGSKIEKYKQLGNAVPVSLGAAIARTIKECLQGNYKGNDHQKFSRYHNTDEISWEEKTSNELHVVTNEIPLFPWLNDNKDEM